MQIPEFKLERYFAQHEFNVPYLLCCSDCESLSIQELLEMEGGAQENFMQQWLGYTESTGHPGLRENIANLYEKAEADNILVHSGAEEAILNFMNVSLDRDSHIIVHAPCYQSLKEIARATGCEVTDWLADAENGWALDVNFLSRAIRKNTKAIVINCPHNPTGYLMPKGEFMRVVEIARERDLYLFSDEVYRLLEYDANDRLPAACDLYEKAVSLGVMSKSFGLAGLRIGWIATKDRALYQKMCRFKDYTTICNSAPSEFLAIVALKNIERIVQRNLEIIKQNLVLLNLFFEKHTNIFDWHPPKAGCIAFPTLKTGQDIETFCADLIQRQGVLLAPSTVFDFGRSHFRIGFGRKNMPEALREFEQYLDCR